MSDDELEAKMADDYAAQQAEQSESEQDPEEDRREKSMALASKYATIFLLRGSNVVNREGDSTQGAWKSHDATASRVQLPSQFLQSVGTWRAI
jgi:hypothetical protein